MLANNAGKKVNRRFTVFEVLIIYHLGFYDSKNSVFLYNNQIFLKKTTKNRNKTTLFYTFVQ